MVDKQTGGVLDDEWAAILRLIAGIGVEIVEVDRWTGLVTVRVPAPRR